MPITRVDFRKAVKCCIEEYIEESENQDGKDYWKQFGSTQEAVADFALYVSICAEDNALPPHNAN